MTGLATGHFLPSVLYLKVSTEEGLAEDKLFTEYLLCVSGKQDRHIVLAFTFLTGQTDEKCGKCILVSTASSLPHLSGL